MHALWLSILLWAAPPSSIEGVVQAAGDGRVLLAVDLDADTARKMPEGRARRIQRVEEAADGTLLGKTLFVRYRVSGDAAALALGRDVGRRVRVELRWDDGARAPVVVAVRSAP